MESPVTFTDARIDHALARFRAFWNAESSEPMVSIYTAPAYRQETDPDKIVAAAVDCIRQDAERGEKEILPCFWPDFGTISTARMWGGKIMPARDNGYIHIEPIARVIGDLAGMQHGTFEESDFHQAIELHRRVCHGVGSDRVFIRTPDFQGPMNTLSLMIEQTEFICAMYENPAAVHRALGLVTDLLIATIRRFLDTVGSEKVVGNVWPYLSLQGTQGVAVTEDYMPLLNPELYVEFGVPCLKRIADAFGGVWIHCCGVYRQHLQTLRHADFKIHGLELAYPQMTPMEVYDVFGDDIAYLVGISPDGLSDFPTLVSYAEFLSKQKCARARFWFCTSWGVEDAEVLRRIVKSGFGKRPTPERNA
jgi:hypothetical protein